MNDDSGEVVLRAAKEANVLGFDPACDALFIERTPNRQLIAWRSRNGESRMVSRNVGYRGTGTWGESNVFSPDRTTEFVREANRIEIIDKRPFNYIRRRIVNEHGLNVGTAWSLAFFFQDAGRIVNAHESTLKAVPGIGDKKARSVRRAVGHLPEPPTEEETA